MRRLFLFLMGVFCLTSPIQAQDIRITHCLKGTCPQGTEAANTLAVHELYALSNNPQTKLADWVAYRPMRETSSRTTDLKRGWKADPLLAPETTLEPRKGKKGDDYKGAFDKHRYHRGHLAPLTLFANTEYWRTTNYYSNIVPQSASLNSGVWKRLEEQEKSLSHETYSLYVVTGPLYEKPIQCRVTAMDEGCLPNADEDHSVPSAYWKVITNKTGSSASAFIMPQTASKDSTHCDYIVPLREVELRTGLNMFPSNQRAVIKPMHKLLGCSTTRRASSNDSDQGGVTLP